MVTVGIALALGDPRRQPARPRRREGRSRPGAVRRDRGGRRLVGGRRGRPGAVGRCGREEQRSRRGPARDGVDARGAWGARSSRSTDSIRRSGLLSSATQTGFLDRFAGDAHLVAARRVPSRLGAVARRTLGARALASASRERERELDLLAYQVDEIEAMIRSEHESERLSAEEARLAHVERLLERADEAGATLSGEGVDRRRRRRRPRRTRSPMPPGWTPRRGPGRTRTEASPPSSSSWRAMFGTTGRARRRSRSAPGDPRTHSPS